YACRCGRHRGTLAASHTFTVLSSLPEAMRLPSGLNATPLTHSVCPLRVRSSLPVAASPTSTGVSPLPAPTRMPTGRSAPRLTQSVCPFRERVSLPVAASHTFTVLSSLPEAMRLPSGLNATQVTHSVCPLRVRSSFPSAVSAGPSGSANSTAADATGKNNRQREQVRGMGISLWAPPEAFVVGTYPARCRTPGSAAGAAGWDVDPGQASGSAPVGGNASFGPTC